MSKYIVTATTLRIRSGPGTNFSILGLLNRDMVIEGGEIQGDWMRVTAPDGKTGWSNRAYLEFVNEPPPPDSGTVNYRVDATTLNLRKGPGLSFAIVGTLKLGETVSGLAISGDNQWAQVRKANGTTGWSSLRYLAQLNPPPPPSPTDVFMTVTTDTLVLRSGPGEGYPITGQLVRGDKVTYLEATPDWKWVNIKTASNATGWAIARSLDESNDLLASEADYPALGLHRALTDSLNLLSSPNETATVVAPMKFNRVVKVDEISPDGKWKRCINAFGEQGWYPVERLARIGDVVIQKTKEEYPWLSIAYAEFGTREIPGKVHNPRIVEYLMSTDLSQKYPSLPDETDWCAGFVNWCIKKAGLPVTNSALVYPWRNWGKASLPPKRGAVTCFQWDDGWAHVSFYLGDIGNYVVCLGGNQSDAVWFSIYHKRFVSHYRVLA